MILDGVFDRFAADSPVCVMLRATTHRGMMVVLEPAYWNKRFAALPPSQMAQALIRIAKKIPLTKYRKHK